MEEELPRPEWAARWHELRSNRRVAAALCACVAIAAGAAWLRAGTASAKAPTPSRAATSSTDGFSARATPTTKSAATLIVDVVGAVRRSGIVRLAAGARVVDAIAAAGGATANADLARLNLAAPVPDGSRIAVPVIGAPAPPVDPSAVGSTASDGGTAPTGPVNLNTATAAQLDALPGIGPATAAAIIHDRETHGPFASVNDLTRVRGIGPAKLDQLRDLVTV